MRRGAVETAPAGQEERLRFFESLDRIDGALRGREALDDALSDALDEILDVLACDRVWLSYPCDLEAPGYRVIMERTRPAWPGALAAGVELAATPPMRELHRVLLSHPGPHAFGAGAPRPLPDEARQFGVRVALMMVIDPRVDKPYVLGLHRCENDRPCSEDELRLFQEIGRRLGDTLATTLVVRSLRDREQQLERAGRIAHVGYWERDERNGRVTVSAETCRIFGIAATEREHGLAHWSERVLQLIHPGDRARVETALAAALADGAAYDIEYRIARSDGSLRIVHSRAEIVRSEDGRPALVFGTIQDVTARRHVEERLVASEGLFRAVVDHATDAMFLHDHGGRVLDVNRQACESLGYTRDELLGMSPADFDPDATPELMARLGPRMRSGEVVAFDTRHRRKDGSSFPVEIRVRHFPLGERELGVALVRDISERKRVEQELRASEERFRELAETIAEVFWVIDADKQRMLYISPGYERTWGRSCQSLYDSPRSWLDAIHPDDRARVLDAATQKQTLGTYNEEYRIVRPDGEVRWVRDVAFPVRDAAGIVQRMVGVARDVTDLRSLQDQLLQSQKMDAIGQLAGGIAHDFNNLLGAILLETEHAEQLAALPDEARKVIAEVRAAAQRGAALTRQLLLFGRREVMRPRALDVNTVVADLVKMLQRIIGEDIRLEVRLAESPLLVLADGGMLEQVLVNFAVNARDAMPAGGTLAIVADEHQIDEHAAARVADARPGRYARLRVSDTGPGISPEILPRIFEPFFTTKQPGRGTGLGLATAFGIAKQHQGWIAVESAPGHGAAFHVFLPLHDDVRVAPASGAGVPLGGTETILLVEDEDQMRRGVRRLLERHGYRVVEAESGVAALAAWSSVRASVSVVVTDVVMPGGVDGYELASQLCADKPELVVIFASGYSTEALSRRARTLPHEQFLQKPFASRQLLDAISSVLARRRG
ncbi:MAG TPA: PAS domain S-box protein [Kofleriaceae bacterium]